MKTKTALRFGVLATLAAATLGVSEAHAASITWRSSLSSAITEAKRTGKPLLVNFSTEWCGPCQILKKTTFKDPKIINESKKWVMVYIDGDKQEKVAAKYKVEEYPTFLVMKPNGTVVTRMASAEKVKTTNNFLKWWKPQHAAAKR